jgi:N utilization substance protein A
MDLGRAQAIMPPDEQVPTERYRKGQRVKVYVLDVRNSPKGPEILVSRSHKNLLKRLFEIEVPEVYNGVVEIKAIAREAGFRSKVAVYSSQEGIDPVGSCIGIRGNRIQSIVNELQGEKIDVVPWDKDPKVFIGKALSPSEVVHVALNPDDQTAIVVVPDRQLSLAIGREGQNARLAARLAGWRLDIKGLTEWEAIKEEQQKKLEEERRLAAEAKAQQAAQKATTAEAIAEEAVAEPEIELEPAAVAEAVEQAVEQAQPEPEPVLATAEAETIAADEVDEDALLEALLREEAAEQEPAAEEAEAVTGLSVEELASFTLEDVEDEDYEEEEAEEGEVFQPEMPVLTPDAGKIRFAEDIVGDFRGGGRRDRKSRRGGGNRGARRGPGR